jgi:hypothetical protein
LHRPFGALHLSIDGWSNLSQSASSTNKTREGMAKALSIFAMNQHAPADKPLDTTTTFKDGVFYVGSIPADLLSPLY